ncbi:MAG TPA: Gfo/Idh/MocA family oxidoreductase [Burkholderiales bacterium]|nr:Gfo/Idh/MocA family oxidoreductase [Burkholderiales bacterium]
MARHRVGIIGLGMALKPHALSLRDLADRVEVAAAFAPSGARRDEAAKTWSLPVVDSLDRILEDPSIDTVLVLTPPWTHTELVGQAARAGKHVLLEKPVEVNAQRAADIVATCERAGVRLAIVFQHRFRPAAIELAGLLRDGRLGKLLSASASIRWWRSPEYFAQPGRGTFARDGGGVLLTQAIHTLDLLLHLAGPAEEVMAYVDTSPLRAIDTEDVVAGAVRYGNGASGVIDATTVTFPGYPERIEIAGTLGSAVLEVETLTVNYMNGERFRRDGAAAGGGGMDPMAFSHEHHARALAEFLDAVDRQREPSNSGRSALHVQRLIDALLASAKRGGPVKIA